MDYEQLENILKVKRLRGAKGTTGTQASFMELFDNDGEKVKRLDQLVAEKMGYEATYPVTGQTYPRKFDTICLNALSLIAQSCYKFAGDLRLLQNLKEMEEPLKKRRLAHRLWRISGIRCAANVSARWRVMSCVMRLIRQ